MGDCLEIARGSILYWDFSGDSSLCSIGKKS